MYKNKLTSIAAYNLQCILCSSKSKLSRFVMPQGKARYNGWIQKLWVLKISDHDIRHSNFQFENNSGIGKHEYT